MPQFSKSCNWLELLDFQKKDGVDNASRADKKVEEEPAEVTEVPPPPISKELKRRWSYFIRKVYETDPLECPKCSGEMRIISPDPTLIGRRNHLC